MTKLVSTLLLLSLASARADQVERALIAMGTEARISVAASDRTAAIAASEAAFSALRDVEERLRLVSSNRPHEPRRACKQV